MKNPAGGREPQLVTQREPPDTGINFCFHPMIAVHWSGAYTIRTCATFLLDRLATYSATTTAMHHITAYNSQI